jgi:sialic acid synthase SpsE
VKIRDHEIGTDGVYVIAEACSNHAGRLQYAKQLVKLAAEAGADAVKFQRFRIKNMGPCAPNRTQQYSSEMLDKLAKLELRDEWLKPLRTLAHECGLAFIVTPFDPESVEVLNEHVDAWKLRHTDFHNSSLLTSLPDEGNLIRSIPSKDWTVETKDYAPVGDEAWLYCPESYPTPLDDLHLPTFSFNTGLSDHTISLMTGALAVARGARVLEKHFRLGKIDKSYLDKIVDAQVSLTPGQLASYIWNVRNAEKAIRPRKS